MNNSKNVIGPYLRRLRFKRGMSQSDVAAKLQIAGFGVRRSGVAKIESGIRGVSDRELLYILVVFDISLKELMES